MEMITSISSPILSKIGEKLMELTKNHLRYLFCFKSIVQDLEEEEENLKLVQDRVKHDVERALRNTEEIEKDVQKWLTEVSNVLVDVLKSKEDILVNKRCLSGQCPNLGWRYEVSKTAEEKRNVMSTLRSKGNFQRVSYRVTLPGIEFLAPKDFELFESSKSTFNQIIEALKDDTINIIGLYGMGGVGKTTLAKFVGNKAKEEKIFHEVIMATVSQNSVENIQDQISESLNFKIEEKTQVKRAERLNLRFTKIEKKMLIILDDVWKKLDLKTTIGISFDDGYEGCKILLTTRLEQVCTAMDCQRKIRLNVLSEEEGLGLLKKHATVGDDSPTLNSMAIDVAGECKGLPLAIVTIGSALKDKGIDEWKVMSKKLKKSKLEDIHNGVNIDVDVYACLKLSYDYLKGEEIRSNFLLCSLFPEDYKIPLEELVRYGLGIDLYHGIDSIEDARTQLRVMVNNLKASCLLADVNDERLVKMHDMIRDVALEIAFKDKKFIGKAGLGLREWPKEENIEELAAISLMSNEIQVLPNGLICPKLKILLLGGEFRFYFIDISDEFFKEMRSLKVFTLSYRFLSLESLQFLTMLRILHLKYCRLEDISSLRKLKKLEILSLEGSLYDELPEELGELSELKLLDLIFCTKLKRIHCNVMPRLSQLEELYIGSRSFREWEVERTSGETSNASLLDLNSLPRLAILSLDINPKCLSEDLVFRKLQRYDITMNGNCSNYPSTRTLRLEDIKATSLTAFKALYPMLQYLSLNKVRGCQNIIPSIDKLQAFNDLNFLELKECNELECLIDTQDQQWLPTFAFSNLVELSLKQMNLKEICYGRRPPSGFLEKLDSINVRQCHVLCSLFPAMLVRRLQKLKRMNIEKCYKLQEVFQLEGLNHPGVQSKDIGLFSSLEDLILEDLPQLMYIWKGPTQQVSLQSLTEIQVRLCESLTYFFSLSLARSLVQLKSLIIISCKKLEHVVIQKLEDDKRMENDIVLPQLRKLKLEKIPNLIGFCPKNYYLTWLALEELIIIDCPNLTAMSFIAQHEVIVQALKQKLRVLKVEGCDNLGDTIPAVLIHGLENLEELTVSRCIVKVIFQLEDLVGDRKFNKFSLPNLKILKLAHLKELENLCKGPMRILSLQNLSTLTVIACHKLRHIFPLSFAQKLSQLQELHIFYCQELEQIMVKDETETRDDKEIVLPKLKYLALKSLGSLNNLCPVGYHLIFPSLRNLILRMCRKMNTRFLVAQNGFVHALAEAPQDDGRAQTNTTNIDCWTLDEILKRLPPYTEK